MTIVTRRSLLVPYNESLQSEFLLLNCCAINRAQMNGAQTVSSAKQLFDKALNDRNTYAMAVLDSQSREYMGHVFICDLDSEPELGFIFDKDYWGRGLASEVLLAFFPKAVRDLNLTRVTATANVDHQPSIRILSKLGFELRALKQDTFGPYNEYLFTSDVAVNQPSLAENPA
ncbi:GNAT family N-acetyltransferase [Vibrio sinaloensis]|uniref:GNAT family N-acetyltransferase n=1 Tax=Photobacterium sp. (strain ATCC 43367) TaxID=379097 RepID=UPI002051BC14|nr:GNAT family N-acetyltransferase [Vibrio sinaloensis]UPQ87296.1 GNAT family N-acetyltransferase [Vibrio sinaloensis]